MVRKDIKTSVVTAKDGTGKQQKLEMAKDGTGKRWELKEKKLRKSDWRTRARLPVKNAAAPLFRADTQQERENQGWASAAIV